MLITLTVSQACENALPISAALDLD